MHQHWLYDQGIGYEVQYLAYFTLLFGMASITKDTFFSLLHSLNLLQQNMDLF